MRDLWNLSDKNMIQTYNHLVRKRTMNRLAKLAKWPSYGFNANMDE